MSKDHPDIVAYPPVILGGTLLLALVLDRIAPLDFLAEAQNNLQLVIGIALFILSQVFMLGGVIALKKAGSNVSPHKPTLKHHQRGAIPVYPQPDLSGHGPVLRGAQPFNIPRLGAGSRARTLGDAALRRRAA